MPTLTANKLNSNTNRHSRPHASISPQHPSTRHHACPPSRSRSTFLPTTNNDLRPDDAFSHLWYPIVIEHNLCVSLKSECLGLPCATVQSVHYMLQLHGSDRCSRLSLRQELPVANSGPLISPHPVVEKATSLPILTSGVHSSAFQTPQPFHRISLTPSYAPL